MIFFFKDRIRRKNINRNLYKKKNRKQRKLMFPKHHLFSKTPRTYTLLIPNTWKYTINYKPMLGQYGVYLYSKVYFFKLPIPVSKLIVQAELNNNALIFISKYNHTFYTLGWNFLLKTFSAFTRPFFFKVKFKGKGYYIYKNKKQTITPQFGHSHRLYLYAYYASVHFLSKTHIFIFGLVKEDVLMISRGIKSMRPINIFTGRGVRFSRQIIYKKTGKVSSYR